MTETEANIDDSLTDKGPVEDSVGTKPNGLDDSKNGGEVPSPTSDKPVGGKSDSAQRRPSIANLLTSSNQVADDQRYARGLDQAVGNSGRYPPSYGYGLPNYLQQQQPYMNYPPPPHVQSGVGGPKHPNGGKDDTPTDPEVTGAVVDKGVDGGDPGVGGPGAQGGPFGGFQQPVQYGNYYSYPSNFYYANNNSYAQASGSNAAGVQGTAGQGPGQYGASAGAVAGTGAGQRSYYYGNNQYSGANDANYQGFDGQGPQPTSLAANEQGSAAMDGGEHKAKKRKKSATTPVSTSERPYRCTYENCEWSFARLSDQRRHIRSHEKPTFHCPYWRSDPTCHRNGGAFNRLDVLKRHLRLVHFVQFKQSESGWCRVCQKMFTSPKHFVEHCEGCASAVRPAEWKVDTADNIIPQTGAKNRALTVTSEGVIGDADNTVRLLTNSDPNVDSQLKDQLPVDIALAEKGRNRPRAGANPGRKKTLSQSIQAGHHASG